MDDSVRDTIYWPPLKDRELDVERLDESFGHYKVGDPIRDSSFGWVFQAICLDIPAPRACKVMKPHGEGYAWDPRSPELKAFAALAGCPSLLLGFDAFETEEGYVGFFMEYCAGRDLGALLEARELANPMKLDDARECCRMILTAIAEVHSRGWAHRDVKPENFMIRLIKQNGQDIRQLLLGDFGFATEDTSCLTGLCGTDGYIAPEVLNGLPYSKAADMWSVGCCLYWIVTGWHPFHERLVGKQSLTEAVTSGLFHPGRLEKAGRSCRAVVELIEGLLCPIPEQRLTAEDALKSPFFGRPPQEAILEARTRY